MQRGKGKQLQGDLSTPNLNRREDKRMIGNTSKYSAENGPFYNLVCTKICTLKYFLVFGVTEKTFLILKNNFYFLIL
jgi:hypothetical protein